MPPKELGFAKNSHQQVPTPLAATTTTTVNQEPENLQAYKDRIILIDDVLIDLCCGKRLLDITKFDGRLASILNKQIAQFGLQAMRFCCEGATGDHGEGLGLQVEIMNKAAERFIPMGKTDCLFEHAYVQVSDTLVNMERLANGESIKDVCNYNHYFSPAFVNCRIAIFATQVLSTLKYSGGLDKGVCFDAVAKLLAENPFDKPFLEEMRKK